MPPMMRECGWTCREYTCPTCGAQYQLSIKAGPVIDDPTTGISITSVNCPFCKCNIGDIKPYGDIPTAEGDE